MSLSIVGIGPGAGADLTGRARRALEECEIIVGYTVYAQLLETEFSDKRIVATPMRTEVQRCRAALEYAVDRNVAMVCSGDPGVFGMAGLCCELAGEYPGVEIEVVPGVTAATGGAALLGAPLTCDFAVISLSDLLTPWNSIETRLRACARAGMVICLYNPVSKRRPDHLRRAVDVLSEELPGGTVCGLARNVGRDGECARICTLDQLAAQQADMFTVVYIGNGSTRTIDGRMVTPRGYLQRRD